MSTPTPGISTDQIKDHAVERHNLDTTDPGQAVAERLIAGSGITLSSTGADSGTGDVTVSVNSTSLVVWNGTTAEVVAARTRTAKGVSATTLEGRLDAMEVDIAAGGGTGAAPATATTFGTVETDITEMNGSVVYTKTTMDTLLAGKINVGAALPESEITGLLMDLSNKITTGAALQESEVTNLVSDLGNKIAAGTTLPESEISGLIGDLAGKLAAGAAIPESEITGLAADLAARLAVAGTPAVGQVPVVTSVSPLTVQWQTPPGGTNGTALKRRLSVPFYAGSAADTTPNLVGAYRFPPTSGNAAANWKLMSAELVTDPPNANATTVQLYSSAGGNAAFGAGTACFAAPLSASSASAYETATTAFAGTVGAAGLPAGARAAAEFTANGCANAVLWTEWEEA